MICIWILGQSLLKCGPLTSSSISILWVSGNILETFGGLILYLLNEKLWGWGPAICVLTSPVILMHVKLWEPLFWGIDVEMERKRWMADTLIVKGTDKTWWLRDSSVVWWKGNLIGDHEPWVLMSTFSPTVILNKGTDLSLRKLYYVISEDFGGRGK